MSEDTRADVYTNKHARSYLDGANAGVLDASPHRLTSLLLQAVRDKVAVAEGAIDHKEISLHGRTLSERRLIL